MTESFIYYSIVIIHGFKVWKMMFMNELPERDVEFEKALKTLKLAKNKIYEPVDTLTPGYMSWNLLAYMTIKDISHPTSDFFVRFAEDTEKKLFLHPFYTLNVLKEETSSRKKELVKLAKNGVKETYTPTLEEFMSGQYLGKGTKMDVDEEIRLNSTYKTNIHRAMLKLSKENPSYIV